MSGTSTTGIAHLERAESLRSKWGWFLALGVVLALAGALAVALPAISAFATSVVLGVALMLAGVAEIVQSLQIEDWSGFVWRELTAASGLVALAASAALALKLPVRKSRSDVLISGS
jgi:uncharacterized membrane protein HdeD (DUF308 family)